MKAIIFNQENIELIKKGLYEDVETVDIPEKESHFKKHGMKYVYGLGLVAACGLCYYAGVKSNHSVKASNSSTNSIGDIKASENAKVDILIDNSIRTYIISKVGHPGNKIMCNETKELFNSQYEACEAMGLSKTGLSKHMNGKSPHVKGYTFTPMVPEDSQK